MLAKCLLILLRLTLARKNQEARQQPPDIALVLSDQELERARQLHYSKAMKFLRSPGLAANWRPGRSASLRLD